MPYSHDNQVAMESAPRHPQCSRPCSRLPSGQHMESWRHPAFVGVVKSADSSFVVRTPSLSLLLGVIGDEVSRWLAARSRR